MVLQRGCAASLELFVSYHSWSVWKPSRRLLMGGGRDCCSPLLPWCKPLPSRHIAVLILVLLQAVLSNHFHTNADFELRTTLEKKKQPTFFFFPRDKSNFPTWFFSSETGAQELLQWCSSKSWFLLHLLPNNCASLVVRKYIQQCSKLQILHTVTRKKY